MSDPQNIKLRLLAAFRHLMTPLVRILLRNGIAFNDFAEVIKEVYAKVCAQELAVPGRRMSHSRVAIITGLTRKEVAKIFSDEDRLRKALDSNANRVARVLQGWHNDPDFMGPYGMPRDLFMDTDPSGAMTFAELVRRYSGDMPPRAMLDELLRVSAAIELEGKEPIRVLQRTYIPEALAPETIEVFARGVRRYIDTIDHNLRAKDPADKRFERWVFPDDGINEEAWDEFRAMVRDRLEELIRELDTKFSWYDRPKTSKGEKVISVGVGLYVYRDDPEHEKALANLLSEFDE